MVMRSYRVDIVPENTAISAVYLWGGHGRITVGGRQYDGVVNEDGLTVLSIGGDSAAIDGPGDTRLEVTCAIAAGDAGNLLRTDRGRIRVRGDFIFSLDDGETWNDIGRGFGGWLSNSRIQNGVYTAEIEPLLGDNPRGLPKYYSHASQQAEYPGDTGAQFASDPGGQGLYW